MVLKRVILIIAVFLVFFVPACEKQKSQAENEIVPEAVETEEEIIEIQEIPSVCLADSKWIVDKPTYKKDEYNSVTELARGEIVNWTGEEVEGDNSDGTVKLPFVQVTTIDGKTGWIWANYIARKAKPGAITKKTSKYIKPSITSRESEYPLLPMDIIAVIEESSNWLKIYTERDGSAKEWWILNDPVSYEQEDINTAVLGQRALAHKTMAKRIESIEKIMNAPSLQGSLFIPLLTEELAAVPVECSANGVINDNDVMLREAPNLRAKVIMRLKRGDKVIISLRTKEKIAVNDLNAFWYGIELESGEKGWSYGYFIDLD